METNYSYPNEPVSSWYQEDLDKFLVWGHEIGISDVHLIPGQKIWIRLHGKWVASTSRAITTHEITTLLDSMTGNASASARIKGGVDMDFSYEIKESRVSRKRFRGNATGCRDGYSFGISMVLRTIPSIPPPLGDLNVEQGILDAAFPNNGLVLVTGVMGSGKSTLLSSFLRHVRETQARNILTYEAPIEFDFAGIPDALSPIVQTGIPEHLTDFSNAPRNAARRAADVILVGESRDPETLRGMIESAEIGVAAYSTVHTRSVAETPTRIINVFESTMQNQISSTLISSLRLIVQQRLVPSQEGGRLALREFLAFDSKLREELFKTSVPNLIPVIQRMTEAHGQPLLRDAANKLEAGLITEETYRIVEQEVG